MQVLVRDNNVDQALRVLKKKMQREGLFREMKQRKTYEKPSERKTREKAEAIRRARKQARKIAIREGLIAAPKPKQAPLRGRRPTSARPVVRRWTPPANLRWARSFRRRETPSGIASKRGQEGRCTRLPRVEKRRFGLYGSHLDLWPDDSARRFALPGARSDYPSR